MTAKPSPSRSGPRIPIGLLCGKGANKRHFQPGPREYKWQSGSALVGAARIRSPQPDQPGATWLNGGGPRISMPPFFFAEAWTRPMSTGPASMPRLSSLETGSLASQ